MGEPGAHPDNVTDLDRAEARAAVARLKGEEPPDAYEYRVRPVTGSPVNIESLERDLTRHGLDGFRLVEAIQSLNMIDFDDPLQRPSAGLVLILERKV